MALEQTHQAGDLVDHGQLLFGREQGHHAALVHRVLAPLAGLHEPLQGGQEPLRIGIDRLHRGVDQAEEVLAHPRHPGELGPVGHLVERQPEAELLLGKRIAPLQRQDVGSDVVDDVLLVGLFVLDHQQVVLTEHPGRHPTEHHPELGAGDLAPEVGPRTLVQLLTELLGDRAQEPGEGRQVRVDPTVAVGDAATSVAAQRTQTGLGRDQIFGHRRVAIEVLFEAVAVLRTGEGFPAGHAPRDLSGNLPVDGVCHQRVRLSPAGSGPG